MNAAERKAALCAALPETDPETLLVFDELPSTNDLAKRLGASGAPHGTAVLAGMQTAGRGRLGRAFASPPEGGIYLSLILRPQAEASRLLHLTPVLAVAACDAAESVTQLRPDIKWVNDLLLDGKKLGGILTEWCFPGSGAPFAVAGIGLNCNTEPSSLPPEVRELAVSLRQKLGRPADLTALTAALIRAWLAACGTAVSRQTSWMQRYRAGCVTVGKRVELLREGSRETAFAESVDDDGALLVRTEDGAEKRVYSGEVSVRGEFYGNTG